MVVINNIKYACDACIRGHRTSKCSHTDRELKQLRPKGRPMAQCDHCKTVRAQMDRNRIKPSRSPPGILPQPQAALGVPAASGPPASRQDHTIPLVRDPSCLLPAQPVAAAVAAGCAEQYLTPDTIASHSSDSILAHFAQTDCYPQAHGPADEFEFSFKPHMHFITPPPTLDYNLPSDPAPNFLPPDTHILSTCTCHLPDSSGCDCASYSPSAPLSLQPAELLSLFHPAADTAQLIDAADIFGQHSAPSSDPVPQTYPPSFCCNVKIVHQGNDSVNMNDGQTRSFSWLDEDTLLLD